MLILYLFVTSLSYKSCFLEKKGNKNCFIYTKIDFAIKSFIKIKKKPIKLASFLLINILFYNF